MTGGADESFDPVAYINEPRWRESRLGLDRIAELLDRLGRPQDTLRFVHVAGTNGKGSTCAFTARILQEAGYRTGLFTSPYIFEFAERIRIDGCNIPADKLRETTLDVREQACRMHDHPTEFELMCAVALLYFSREACDVVVLEVGLGGRLDSTNVIDAPLVCAIAPISLDHTDVLGSDLSAIAGEKAGIVKPGTRVVSAPQPPEAVEVLRARCRNCGCPLRFVDQAALDGTPSGFRYGPWKDLRLGLMGTYQIQNAALAIEIVCELRQLGFVIDDDAVKAGLAATRWPGRFQLAARRPDVIVDGGHNEQGARALAASLEAHYPGRKAVFVLGVLRDKDYPAMIEALVAHAAAFICVSPPSPRALPAAELALSAYDACLLHPSVECIAVGGFSQAIRMARDMAGQDGLVCACGSLYSVSEVMAAL